MSENRDEWVRVESEDELRPGMAVQLRPCLWCGKVDTFLIGREVACDPVGVNPDGTTSLVMGVRSFEVLARACKNNRTPTNYGRAIAHGRLYRLRDVPAEDTTTVATKRRVSVKAGR